MMGHATTEDTALRKGAKFTGKRVKKMAATAQQYQGKLAKKKRAAAGDETEASLLPDKSEAPYLPAYTTEQTDASDAEPLYANMDTIAAMQQKRRMSQAIAQELQGGASPERRHTIAGQRTPTMRGSPDQ